MESSDDAADGVAAEEEPKVNVSTKNSGMWKLYISRALTAWGDRLWSFGLGLFLLRVRISPSTKHILGMSSVRCGQLAYW